jgi:hypothetical protein
LHGSHSQRRIAHAETISFVAYSLQIELMEYFDRVYTQDWLQNLHSSSSASQSPVMALLTGDSDWHRKTKQYLDTLLELAFRHGILDKEFLNRIRDVHIEAFSAAYAELFVARLFENIGLALEFRPQTRTGPGEFKATLE